MSRLGRPTSADSHQTRLRIVASARALFAARGYDGTSNRVLAEAVGLTTGALYHYFDRKLDLYAAVYDETQRFVYQHLNEVLAEVSTFIDALRGVLEVAHRLNNQDPTLALFLRSCRVDAQRDPQLAAALPDDDERRHALFAAMVDLGIGTGEIDPSDADRFELLLRTVTIGLVDAVSSDRTQHRQAVDAIMDLFEGKLVRPAAPPAEPN